MTIFYLTPLQILHDRIDSAPEAVEIDWDEYGIDPVGINDEDEEADEGDGLVFYPLRCPLSEEQYNQFSAEVDPFKLCDESADFIPIYVYSTEKLRSIMANQN
jgi:hypothetical protein